MMTIWRISFGERPWQSKAFCGVHEISEKERSMKIGIIGAGQIGGTLTRRLARLGHEVSVANSRGPESLAGLAKETGAKAVTVEQAAKAGQVVIVTIPEGKIQELPKDLFDAAPADVVVVDTGNYYPRERDGRIAEIEAGMTESRWVATQLDHPVVKAFNNMYAKHLLEFGRPAGAPNRLALPVAGDDARAKDNWDSMESTREGSTTHGGCSQVRLCTPKIRTPSACSAVWQKRRESVRPNGGRRR
jgi:predicted dinucleotide-binding enzyme